MFQPENSTTKTQAVFDRLRADITSGRLTPGQRLSPDALKAKLDVSISVIREALTRLVARGLVQAEQNRGFRVKQLSVGELIDLTYARQINECAALRMAVERHDLEWESSVLAAHHYMSGVPIFSPEDPTHRTDEYAVAHEKYHRALFDGCNNRTLIEICRDLSDRADIYRGWASHDRPESDITETHKEMVEAVISRDAERVVNLHKQHLQGVIDVLLERSDGEPDAKVTRD